MRDIVFWQTIISPHMIGLAGALVGQGFSVTYVAGRAVSPMRKALGWTVSAEPGVRVIDLESFGVQPEKLVQTFPVDTVHVVQGLRRNGYIKGVIKVLRSSRRRWGAIIETIDDTGILGPIKRADYRWALRSAPGAPQFMLAIGSRTSTWVSERQFPEKWSFPFIYFLPTQAEKKQHAASDLAGFRIGFIGQLIPRKRVDLLIRALCEVNERDWHLEIVGAGPLEKPLKKLASSVFGPGRVQWHGALPMDQAKEVMSQLDCLVLPSDHDGWGAVVSEALMAGVPAICSDVCGTAAIVRASGRGGVFPKGDAITLRRLIEDQLDRGTLSQGLREDIASWGRCLNAEAGAIYLKRILSYRYADGSRPIAPWSSS